MHLQAEPLATIKPLDQHGKRLLDRPFWPHNHRSVLGDDLPQRTPGVFAVGYDRLGLRSVDNLPAFADRPRIGQGAAQRSFQRSAAPHALLINRAKN